MFFLDIFVDVAGIAGFCISIFLLFLDWFRKKETYQLSVLDYADFGGTTRFFIIIQNNSTRPLIIKEITYCEVACELLPKRIRGNPESWNGAATHRFPIRVLPHDAEAVFLEFLVVAQNPLTPGTTVNFQIQTISQTEERSLLLGNKSHYLNKIQ